MNSSTHLRCSLCSRDFPQREIRQSPVRYRCLWQHFHVEPANLLCTTAKSIISAFSTLSPSSLRLPFVPQASVHAGSFLCRTCWSVMCPQPWPTDDSAHGGHLAGAGGSRPDLLAAGYAPPQTSKAPDARYSKAHQQIQAVQMQAQEVQQQQRLALQRSASVANMSITGPVGMAVPQRPPNHQPSSMPERPVLLSGSAEGPRWDGLAAQNHQRSGSAPSWRHSPYSMPLATPAPPTFSPIELKNMMHEESLELFESQSHLLDPESRQALHRQRQYLQWQSSMEEPGPMQSALDRQDSAGSGCHLDDQLHGAAAFGGLGLGRASSGGGSGETSSGGTAGGSAMLHELQEVKRHLAVVSREREELATRVQQLEAELQAQREAVLCKICRRTARNCVVLPCLHFTSCDVCFKKHCTSSVSCPMCSGRVTGFQTLLMMT